MLLKIIDNKRSFKQPLQRTRMLLMTLPIEKKKLQSIIVKTHVSLSILIMNSHF